MTAETTALQQAQLNYRKVAGEVLAGLLVATPHVAGRVLAAIPPEVWPHAHYATIADTIQQQTHNPPGSSIDPLQTNSHLMAIGALKNSDMRKLWNDVAAPGTGDPSLLEPQLLQRVHWLKESHFRIVFHTVFGDDGAFTWTLEELQGAVAARLDRLRAAWPKQAHKAVPHAS